MFTSHTMFLNPYSATTAVFERWENSFDMTRPTNINRKLVTAYSFWRNSTVNVSTAARKKRRILDLEGNAPLTERVMQKIKEIS